MVEAFPSRHRGKLLAPSVDLIPVVFTATRIHVHISSANPALSLPRQTGKPERENNGKCKVGIEKALGIANSLSNRRNSYVELRRGR